MQVDYFRFSIRGWFILPYLLLFPLESNFRLTSGWLPVMMEMIVNQIHIKYIEMISFFNLEHVLQYMGRTLGKVKTRISTGSTPQRISNLRINLAMQMDFFRFSIRRRFILPYLLGLLPEKWIGCFKMLLHYCPFLGLGHL